MKVRRLILMLGALYLPCLWASLIAQVQNLASESRQAMAEDKVYLLYVSRLRCPYCAKLEKNVLLPMLNNKQYGKLVELRELSFEGGEVVDFNNQSHLSIEIINQFAIPGTPTLLFLDNNGEELASRIVGYNSEDFYWYYFDKAIEAARTELLAR